MVKLNWKEDTPLKTSHLSRYYAAELVKLLTDPDDEAGQCHIKMGELHGNFCMVSTEVEPNEPGFVEVLFAEDEHMGAKTYIAGHILNWLNEVSLYIPDGEELHRYRLIIRELNRLIKDGKVQAM